ncbi:MAG: hydantoinase/oxoprolinase family protein [Deltaproteobacteria bacterium]|nr:hydantoinase/oxoprolinase family protein [Deltaproteobacteria bacterium]
MAQFKVGIDVGGTFTDLTAVEMETGNIVASCKVPSTPKDFVRGVIHVLKKSEIPPADVEMIIHGTTIGTNSIIERTGAKTTLITTDGFRDVLLAQRGGREQIYDLDWQPQLPPIKRRDILTVRERIDYRGRVVTPLNEDDVRRIAGIVGKNGGESIGICFINSFVNSEHEFRAREILEKELPDVPICISYELAPVMKEYERTNSTVINALLMPILTKYLDTLVAEIRSEGYKKEPLIIHSGGGVMTISATRLIPARTCISGPAAGVMGGLIYGKSAGFENVITLDMGGTSTDVSLCNKGTMGITTEWKLAYDLPILIPAIDVLTIGAGGGSISWVDETGSLRNGPQSAGAYPGPMCYGTGGTRPTNTDAQLVLGRLSTKQSLGGEVEISKDLAYNGIREKVAEPLGMKSVEEAAAGILKIAAFNMVNATRIVSVERGYDPTDFTLLAFGGGGPMFAVEIARGAMIPNVVVPMNAGVLSSWGGLTADIRHDFARSLSKVSRETTIEELNSAFQDLDQTATNTLLEEGIPKDRITLEHYADLKYYDQSVSLTLKMPETLTDMEKDIVDAYVARQEMEFGYSMPPGFTDVEVVNLRVSGLGEIPVIEPVEMIKEKGSAEDALVDTREVYFEGAFIKTPIYDRTKLKLEVKINGPAIIEEIIATTVVPPEASATVDKYGNIIIKV